MLFRSVKGKFYAERNWEVMDMSQVEEFVKIVEGVKDHDVKVVIVTGKPGSGKSKVLREAAEEKKWDYIDCRLLITEKFLEVPPGERQAKAPEMMADILEGYDSEVILLDRLQTLFVPVFHIDVDALLHKLSEKFVIVTAWPGYLEEGKLCYDKFDGTESIRISSEGFTVWNVD